MNKETESAEKRSHVVLRSLHAPTPWEAYVLPVSGFPLPEPECSQISAFIARLSERASKGWHLFSEVFMELEQMKGLDCRYRFADLARDWLPEVGLGVWPDREPPSLWTREEFEALSPGGKLCEVFRISSPAPRRQQAREVMFTFGCVTEMLTPDTSETLLEKMKPVYLNFIKARSHRCFPYYVPLLEGKTIQSMSSEQLSAWCPGVSVYIRQSYQDKGVLFASELSLKEVFEDLGGTISSQPDGLKWKVPV
jgi:hypothetical protein